MKRVVMDRKKYKKLRYAEEWPIPYYGPIFATMLVNGREVRMLRENGIEVIQRSESNGWQKALINTRDFDRYLIGTEYVSPSMRVLLSAIIRSCARLEDTIL